MFKVGSKSGLGVCLSKQNISYDKGMAGGRRFRYLLPAKLVNGIAKPFAEAMKSFGGEIRTEHEVSEIIIENGKVGGRINNGRTYF